MLPQPGIAETHNASRYLREAVDQVVGEIRRRVKPGRPFLAAIDGGSGSGKSAIAAKADDELQAVVIPGDDFFAADIADSGWAARTAREKAADAIDWRRLRRQVLLPLLEGCPARWHPFDFASGVRADGTYGMQTDFVERMPSSIIVLEGTYSARPELSDLIDLAVLVDVPIAIRHQRLNLRETRTLLDAWYARWNEAEEYYLTHVRPPASFDLVVMNASAVAQYSNLGSCGHNADQSQTVTKQQPPGSHPRIPNR